jgi:hypothetical protein
MQEIAGFFTKKFFSGFKFLKELLDSDKIFS